MNALASRKKLLIAESELNRVHLVQGLQAMDHDVHALAQQVKAAGSLVSIGISLSWFQQSKAAPPAEKPSWLQTLLKGAQTAASLWSEFRTPKE